MRSIIVALYAAYTRKYSQNYYFILTKTIPITQKAIPRYCQTHKTSLKRYIPNNVLPIILRARMVLEDTHMPAWFATYPKTYTPKPLKTTPNKTYRHPCHQRSKYLVAKLSPIENKTATNVDSNMIYIASKNENKNYSIFIVIHLLFIASIKSTISVSATHNQISKHDTTPFWVNAWASPHIYPAAMPVGYDILVAP